MYAEGLHLITGLRCCVIPGCRGCRYQSRALRCRHLSQIFWRFGRIFGSYGSALDSISRRQISAVYHLTKVSVYIISSLGIHFPIDIITCIKSSVINIVHTAVGIFIVRSQCISRRCKSRLRCIPDGHFQVLSANTRHFGKYRGHALFILVGSPGSFDCTISVKTLPGIPLRIQRIHRFRLCIGILTVILRIFHKRATDLFGPASALSVCREVDRTVASCEIPQAVTVDCSHGS